MRKIRTENVGQLISIKGTVTRTSEVRPELLFGTFKCLDCGTSIKDVEQQFQYTLVTQGCTTYASLPHVTIPRA